MTKAKAAAPVAPEVTSDPNPPTQPVPPDSIPVEDQEPYNTGPVWEGGNPGEAPANNPDAPPVDTTYWPEPDPPPETPTPTPPPAEPETDPEPPDLTL